MFPKVNQGGFLGTEQEMSKKLMNLSKNCGM
jgi:hypothetical protein